MLGVALQATTTIDTYRMGSRAEMNRYRKCCQPHRRTLAPIMQVSIYCHPGEVFNYFKYKLVGGHKGIWKLAQEESQMGTTGSIWRAKINDETFYELISQRGRGGSFHGLEMIKIAADSNIEKMAFLLQLVQDPARLQWPALTLDCEQSLFGQSSLSSAGLERANCSQV